jgi:hypothetical protein
MFEERIDWVETTGYVDINLGKRRTLSLHIDQVWKKIHQMMGKLGALLNRKCDIYVRKELLSYKNLIGPILDESFSGLGPLPAHMSGVNTC